MSVIRAYYVVEAQLAGVWTTISQNAISDHISGVAEGGGSSDNGMATGADSSQSFSVSVLRSALGAIPNKLPVRVTYRITDSAGDHVARSAVGRVAGVGFDDATNSWQLTCEGVQNLVKTTRAFSVPFNRVPAAKKTTIASPTNASNPLCSPLEWLLLTAGGWPAARDFENSSAAFYYDLDQALFAPDWAWFAGEDGWSEALNLVKAVGGQLYVRSDGVLVYRQPLSFGEATAVWTLKDSGTPDPTNSIALYKAFTYTRSDRKAMSQVRCTAVGRRVYPSQLLIEDSEHRFVAAGASVSIELQSDKPLASIDTASGLVPLTLGMAAIQLRPAAIIAGFGENSTVPQGTGGYTHTITATAQRIFLTIANVSGRPFVVYMIRVTGEPIGAAATVTATAGTGTETLNIEDNAFIQRYSHAEALCKVYLAFYQAMPSGEPRPIYQLADLVFNPSIDIGTAVYVSSLRHGLTAERCVVVNRSHERTGARMNLDVVPVSDLPRQSDFYTFGGTSYALQTKRIGW